MSLWQDYILTFMEYMFWMLLVLKIVNEDIREYWKAICIYLPVNMLIEVSKIWIPEPIAIVLYYFSLLLFIKITFKKEYITSLLIGIYSAILMLFLEAIFTGALSLFVPKMEYLFIYGVIVVSTCIIAAVLAYLFIPLYKVVEALEEKNALLSIILAVSVVFLCYMYYQKLTTFDVAYLYDIKNTGIFILLVVIIYFAAQNILELKARDEALKKYNEFESLISDYGVKQHEYDKHLQTLYALAYLNDDMKTSKHIKEYMNNLQDNSAFTDAELLKLERKPLAAYLHVKMMQLKSAGIHCWINIMDYTISSKIKDYRLVEAVGILIDNAWEAADENHKDVIVNIVKEKNGRATIEVLNEYEYIPSQVLFAMFEKGYSTKKGDKRGIGLYHLKRILAEINCELHFENRKIDGQNYASFKLIL